MLDWICLVDLSRGSKYRPELFFAIINFQREEAREEGRFHESNSWIFCQIGSHIIFGNHNFLEFDLIGKGATTVFNF